MDSLHDKYYKGIKIARQIADVMHSSDTLQPIEQYKELEDWLKNDVSSKEIKERFSSNECMNRLFAQYNRSERDDMSIRLLNDLNKKQIIRKRNIIIKISTSVAAAIFAVSTILYYSVEREQILSASITPSASILTPTLILGNGNSVNLLKVSDEVKVEGYTILKKNGNKLNYSINSDKPETESVKQYNELIIPKMYTYNIVLSDGTVVYLNASSELKYPIQFSGEIREVFLKGEGYFNVKKNDKPFIVHIGDHNVKVYGTKFNVNTTPRNGFEVILLSGSVGVSGKGKEEKMLTPNQKYSYDYKTGQETINRIDNLNSISWMHNKFKSDNDNLEVLLTKISSWYGVEFEFKNPAAASKPVTVSLNMNSDLSNIINVIETITSLKIIRINDKKYVIE